MKFNCMQIRLTLLTILILSISNICIGQKTEPDTDYRNVGGTITTSVRTDPVTLTEITTKEYKDKNNIVIKIQEIRVTPDGKKEKVTNHVTPGGRITQTETVKINSDNQVTFYEYKSFNKNGTVREAKSTTFSYNQDGSGTSTTTELPSGTITTKKLDADILKIIKSVLDNDMPDRSPFLREILPDRTKVQSCIPRADIFGGYSYMNAGYTNGRENLSGGNITVQYHINNHFGIVADGSLHSKKWFEETYRHMNFGIGVQYSFLTENCNSKLMPFVQLIPGRHQLTVRFLGEKWQQDAAFSVLAGGGAIYSFGRVAIMLQAHYFPVFWEAKTQHNIRASAGVRAGFGKL